MERPASYEYCSDQIELTIPQHPRYLKVIRNTAEGIVARSGGSADDVDDLKIAITEICSWLIENSDAEHEHAPLHLTFYLKNKGIEIVLMNKGRLKRKFLDESFRKQFIKSLLDGLEVNQDSPEGMRVCLKKTFSA